MTDQRIAIQTTKGGTLKSRKRLATTVSILAAASLLVTACGDDKKDTAASTAAPSSTAAPAGRCPARKCTTLIHYTINTECTGCTICAQHCPVDAIPMTPYAQHVIDDAKCTRCDTCLQVCPQKAVEVR